MDITISRALRQMKKLKGEISRLSSRLSSCVSWKNGETADFQFDTVLSERDAKVRELTALRARVAAANATAAVRVGDETVVLIEAIIRRDEIKGRLVLFEGLSARRGSEQVHLGYDEVGRASYKEVRWESAFTEPERVAKLDAMRTEIDELNELIETANHRTCLGG